MARIRITVDGKAVQTTAQAAEEHGIKAVTMRGEVRRHGVEPVAHLDARTPLYLVSQIRSMMRSRPGRGIRTKR